MKRLRINRLPWGTVLMTGLVGCTVLPTPQTSTRIAVVHDVNTSSYAFTAGNAGRIVGTVSATANQLQQSGLTSLAGATARAYNAFSQPDAKDPAQEFPVSDPVQVDSDGHFLISSVRNSRPQIFVVVSAPAGNGTGELRFSNTMSAPVLHQDYQVVLDSGTTYTADKLWQGSLDNYVPLASLDGNKVIQTNQVVDVYLANDAQEQQGYKVVSLDQSLLIDPTSQLYDEATKRELNSNSFDHFVDRYPPVKAAVYALAPAILRGDDPDSPNPDASATATPDANATPTPTPKPTQTPDPTVK